LTPEPVSRRALPLPNGFVKLGLAPELLRAVADLGYTQPTLCRKKAIPWPCRPMRSRQGQIH
jgi:superfamily II DNA/RNA helicase